MKNTTLPFIILIGILLRLAFLFHHDLWFDEAISTLISRLPISQLLKAASFGNTPPLYYLLLHLWGTISQNQIWLRIPSLIFSSATIPITYLLTKSLSNQRTALLTALLTAIMPVQLYYTGEVRSYSLLILLSTVYLFLSTQPKSKTAKFTPLKRKMLLSISTACLILTHYSGLFVIVLAGLFARNKPKLFQKHWLSGTLIGIILALPWFIYSFPNPHPQPWLPNPLLSLLFMPVAATVGLTGIVPPSTLTQLPIYIILLVTTFSILSFWLFITQLKIKSKLLVLTSILFILIISKFIPFLSPRLILPFTPLIYLSIAKSLNNKPRINKIYFTLLSLLVIINFTPLLRGPKIRKVIQTAQASQIPIFHTSITTYYPTIEKSQKQTNFYIGPITFPIPLTQLIGGTTTNLEYLSNSKQLILLIDINNTDIIIKNNIIEQLIKTHKLTKKIPIDNFTIQTYTQK